MATLVTGATGFVGYHLVRALLAAGTTDLRVLVRERSDVSHLAELPVERVLGDILQPATLAPAVRGCREVYHTAAAVVLHAGVSPEAMRATNVAGAVNVVRAAAEAGATRIVYTSTVAAVGALPAPVALDESADWDLAHLGSAYLTTKREAEIEVTALARSGAPVVIVNPAFIIGPDDFGPSESGRFFQAITMLSALRGYTSGGCNVVDVRDVATGHLLAATCGRVGERYILGGENVTYERLLATIAVRQGGSPPLVYVPLAALAFASRAAPLARCLLGAAHPLTGFDSASMRLGRYYWFYSSGKAERDLGYWYRPFDETVADTLAFFRRS
jgi:dihydroflavonol-4-reductase